MKNSLKCLRLSSVYTFFITFVKIATCSFLFLSTSLIALAQYDPPPDEPPAIDYGDDEKSIVVRLHFDNPLSASLVSGEVFRGHPRVRDDDGTYSVEVRDLEDGLIEEFGTWNPMLVLGKPAIEKPEGVMSVIFPFSAQAAAMRIGDVKSESEIVSVNLTPFTHDFCRDNSDDPDCSDAANRMPQCDAGGPYVVECSGVRTSIQLSGANAIDPDDDPLTYTWIGPFGTASGSTPVVQFEGSGLFDAELSVSDDFGGSSSCQVQVSIPDTSAPSINCNAPESIDPSDAPVSFSSTADDVCTGEVQTTISSFSCYKFTQKGKVIDKGESCAVRINGDTVDILDSGGIGDHIEWIVLATDANGNLGSRTCSTMVVRKE